MPEQLSRWYRGRMVLGPFQPFETEEFMTLEREIGLPLPEPYRKFLETAGGSVLDYSVSVSVNEDETETADFSQLHRLGRDDAGDYGYGTLLGEYRQTGDWWLGEEVSLGGLLPIARNGGSDTLFLDLNPAGYGHLHAFVHGTPWPGYRHHDIFVRDVAVDFDAYLDGLFIDPEIASTTWTDVQEADPADPWRRTVEEWLDDGLPGWRDHPWATD